MRCPHLNYGAGVSYCRCGGYKGRRASTGSTEIDKGYVNSFCIKNSLECPYNPERHKFKYTKAEGIARQSATNQNNNASFAQKFCLGILVLGAIMYFLSR